jgi:tetratricopeptide (TPR) repeat protein
VKRLSVLGVLLVGLAGAAWYWVQQQHEQAWQLEMGRAMTFHQTHQEAQAEQVLLGLLPNTEKWFPNSPHLVETLCWLGTFERSQTKYELAEPVLKRAIEVAEAQKDSSSVAVGRAKLNLGIIARDESDEVAAETYFSEAVDILTKNPAMAWGDDGAALLNLGYLADKQGRYQEAEGYLSRAIQRYEASFQGNTNSDLAKSHFWLADTHRHLDQVAAAAEQYQAAMKIFQQVEGPQGKGVRDCLSGLALVSQEQNGGAQAREYAQQALEISKSLGGADGASLNNLANVAFDQSRFTEAEGLYQKACAVYEKAGDDAGLATCLANMGNLYLDDKYFKPKKAKPLLRRALSIREKALGSEHPTTAETMSDLALLYFFEKKPAAAEDLANRALPVQTKAFGADSLQVSTTLNRLGLAERDLGRLANAQAHLEKALRIRRDKHAPNSWIAISLQNLADVYELEGFRDKAAVLMATARSVSR